jgi:hypothetical protein
MNPLKEREDVIKACQEIIQLIESNLTAQSELVSSELSSEVVTVDENDLTFFPPSTDVDSSMINLTEKIQSIIANIRPQLSELIYNYLLDTLYPFHFQDIRFSQSLTLAILPRFKQSLDAFIASLKAYVAAEEGNVTGVKEFFDNYALYKNKPLLNGFTLLYVATSNDRRAMVKYLIEEANCSVNAQNQVSTHIISLDIDTSGGARGWQERAEPPPERFEPPPERFEPPLESFETRIEIRKSYVMSAFLGVQPPPEYFLGAEPPP